MPARRPLATLTLCLAALVAAPHASAEGLPQEFQRRIRFLAQEAGSAPIRAATETLLETAFFQELIREWEAHRDTSAATRCDAGWCRGLDVTLTWHVDPDEVTGWTVDVYKVFGPLPIRLPAGAEVEAHLVEAARWRGEQHERMTVAVEVDGDRVGKIHDDFEALTPLPPELHETPAVAFQKRMISLRDSREGSAREAVQALMGWYGKRPMGFLVTVGEAWEQYRAPEGGAGVTAG